MNIYGYVNGDPVNNSDPMGLVPYGGGTNVKGDVIVIACPSSGGNAANRFASFPTRLRPVSALSVEFALVGMDIANRLLELTFRNVRREDAELNEEVNGDRTAMESGSTVLTDKKCNRVQDVLRETGSLATTIGGGLAAVGAAVSGLSLLSLGAGALTGNVPAAVLGGYGAAVGTQITAFSVRLTLKGATLQFIGDGSTKEIYKDVTRAFFDTLPVPGTVRATLKFGAGKLEKYVSDVQICTVN